MQRPTEPRVVALCGSLRDESRTRIALRDALAAARKAGATTELVDLRSHELPGPYAVDSGVPDADDLRRTVTTADSVLLGTPNYHGSYSGALNDALDHCGRDEFAGTTVGLLEAAAGSYPGSAPCHLWTVSRTLGAWTLPTEVGIPDSHSTVTGDGIVEAALSERTRRLGRELVEYAGVARYPEAVDGSAPVDGTRGGGDN